MQNNFLRFGVSTNDDYVWLSFSDPQRLVGHCYTTRPWIDQKLTMRDPRPTTGFSSFTPELHKVLAHRTQGKNDLARLKRALTILYKQTQRCHSKAGSSGVGGAVSAAVVVDADTTAAEIVTRSFSAERMANLKIPLLVSVGDPLYAKAESV